MVDFLKWYNFLTRSRVASRTFRLDESKFLKVEDSVRYHLNYLSYLDLPLGRDPFGFCSPLSNKNIRRRKLLILCCK